MRNWAMDGRIASSLDMDGWLMSAITVDDAIGLGFRSNHGLYCCPRSSALAR